MTALRQKLISIDLWRTAIDQARISKGSISYDNFGWRSNIKIPKEASDALDEACRRMSGLRVTATGGRISRDGQSRIKVELEWALPHNQLFDFAIQKQIQKMEYVSLSSTISQDMTNPSIFHVVGEIRIDTGDALFDLATWKTNISNIDAIMAYSGQATGFLDDDVFKGTAEARYEISYPSAPNVRIIQTGTGQFEFTVLR